ncbi:MAG TPA: CAP domain-containing protein, partial [Actinomycetes bacterium]
DLATYGGEPAAIIVLPDPADSTSANVYVVGPNCGPGVSTPIATTTVRRPVTAAPSPNAPSGTQSAPATPSGP